MRNRFKGRRSMEFRSYRRWFSRIWPGWLSLGIPQWLHNPSQLSLWLGWFIFFHLNRDGLLSVRTISLDIGNLLPPRQGQFLPLTMHRLGNVTNSVTFLIKLDMLFLGLEEIYHLFHIHNRLLSCCLFIIIFWKRREEGRYWCNSFDRRFRD